VHRDPPDRADGGAAVTRALVLAVAAAVLAAAGIVELAAGVRTKRSRDPRSLDGRGRTRPERPLRAARLPALLAALGARLGVPAAPDDLARRLDAAGAPSGLAVGDVMALKWGAAAAGGLAGLALATVLPGRLGLVAIAAAPACAFVGPDAVLARRARRRQAAVADELADVLDLLHVAIEAGLTPMRALGEVGRRRGGVLAGELGAAAARAGLGVARSDALERLTRRCPSDGIAALVAAIRRTERHGAPLAPALHALAADARARRAQRLRERAARAAPKIQLVVALLLVPATMLLVAAALAAALL
jgi:tight adherence protein C